MDDNKTNDSKEEVRARPKTLSYIAIDTPPTQTVYIEGDYFNPVGMVIRAYYSDGTNQIVNLYIYAPQSALTAADTYITVTHQNKSTTQSITVNPANFLLVEQLPSKTTYIAGDEFEPYGMVVKYYSGGSSQTITNYSISASSPLTISDNHITVSYNGISTNVSITVNNPPSTGYFANKYLYKANYGNNPNINTVDGSIRFYNNPIILDRDSYCLNVVLSYCSRMTDRESNLIKGLNKGFKTNYHQLLIQDGKDQNNNDMYKYIDGSGFIHTFVLNLETNNYYDKEGNAYILDLINKKIYDSHDNVLTFNSDGLLISIEAGLNQNNKKIIEYSSSGLSKIYDQRNPNTYITFSYDSSLLHFIRLYYNSTLVKLYTLNNSSGKISSISETVGTDIRTIYEYSYTDFAKISRIINCLTGEVNCFSYVFDSIIGDYRFNSVRTGCMNNGSFVDQGGFYYFNRSFIATNPYKFFSELVIRNDDNIYTSFMSDTNGNPTFVFESIPGTTNQYKTFSKECGVKLNASGSVGDSINGKNEIAFSSPITISEGLSSNDLDSSQYVKLCGFIKIKDNVLRAKLSFSSYNISSRFIDINPNAFLVWQRFEIPIKRPISNNQPVDIYYFSLSLVDENNDAICADLCNLRFSIDEQPKQRLFFLNCGAELAFDELTELKLYKQNYSYATINLLSSPQYMSEDDFINTLKRFYSYPNNLSIVYFNNGTIVDYFLSDFYGKTVDNNEVYFFDEDTTNNDVIGDTNNWFFATSLDAKTKKYYRFKQGYYEIIIRNEVIENNQTIFEDTICRYNYKDQLILEINKDGSETTYEYFLDGRLKKKYVNYVDELQNSITAILYDASLDQSNKYIERETAEYQSFDYEYVQSNLYKKIINFYSSDSYPNSSSFTNYYRNNYLDKITKVDFKDGNTLLSEHNSYVNDGGQQFTIGDGATRYLFLNDLVNQSFTTLIYNGNSYVSIISKTSSNNNRQTVFNTSFDNISSSQTILEENNIYGQITSLKVDGITMVTYAYENGVPESQCSANITSVIDNFISKTFAFSYNNATGKLTKIQLGNYYCEYGQGVGYSEIIINYSDNEQYKIREGEKEIATVIGNTIVPVSYVKYSFDNLQRVHKKTRMIFGNYFDETFTFYPLFPSYIKKYSFRGIYEENFQYDSTGNLSSIIINQSNNSDTVTYTYDYFGRITSENNSALNICRYFTYNNTGRMVTFGNKTLVYDNRGRLTDFGNVHYEYDEYGNRRTRNYTFNYQYTRGNLLVAAGSNSFSYDYLGRRHSKTGSNGIVHYFFYEGNRLVGEDRSDGTKLRFFYDKNGLCGFRYIFANGSLHLDFYYIRNALNDIVGISDGTSIVIRYIYDAWGNHEIVDPTSSGIGGINPFRFKSYYFDEETNLYYLNSRYYDPEIGQFISLSNNVEKSFLCEIGGLNLYNYRNYNSMSQKDFKYSFSILFKKSIENYNFSISGEWFNKWFDTDWPVFLIYSDDDVEIASWELKIFNWGYRFNDQFESKLYNSNGNMMVFIGHSSTEDRSGIIIGGSVGRIAYENRFITISVDFITAKIIIGKENGKWTTDFGFGWADIGVSINFGEIIKAFIEWLVGG